MVADHQRVGNRDGSDALERQQLGDREDEIPLVAGGGRSPNFRSRLWIQPLDATPPTGDASATAEQSLVLFVADIHPVPHICVHLI